MNSIPIAALVLLFAAPLSSASPSTEGSFFYWYGHRIPIVASPDYLVLELDPEQPVDVAGLVQTAGGRISERLAPRRREIAVVDTRALSASQRNTLAKRVGATRGLVTLLPLRSTGALTGELRLVVDRFVLARFTAAPAAAELDALARKWGFAVERAYSYAPGAYRLEVTDAPAAVSLARELVENGVALYAQPDLLVRPRLYQINDDYYAAQWHLTDSNGVRAASAWAHTYGDGAIVVAVADTGVETSHPEFVGGAKLVHPLDVYDGDTDPTPPAGGGGLEDVMGTHGTACAGLVAAPMNSGGGANGGTVGVCPDCTIMPIRLGPGTGMWELGTLITVFDHVRTNGAQVMSNSWGLGPYYLPQGVYEALDAAIEAGVTIFFASGNGGGSMAPRDLASHPGVIAIGGVSSAANHVSYSDAGEALDLVAPTMEVADQMLGCPDGPGIETTDMTGDAGMSPSFDDLYAGFLCNAPCSVDPDYTCFFSGTSAACPIAAGAGGLLLSVYPTLTPDQVRWAFAESADKVGGLAYDASGWNREMGFGRINLDAAITLLQDSPCVPSAETGAACSDGIDNDCDAHVDARDPDCGLVFPPAPDMSQLGGNCTPSAYAEDEASCGLDLGCAGVGEPNMLGGYSSGLCVLGCEDACPTGHLCARPAQTTEGMFPGYCMAACAAAGDCAGGTLCVYTDLVGDTSAGVCMPGCSSTNDCVGGLTCNTAIHACGGTALVGGEDDGEPGGDPMAGDPTSGGDSYIPRRRPTADEGCGCNGAALPDLLLLLPLAWLARRRRP